MPPNLDALLATGTHLGLVVAAPLATVDQAPILYLLGSGGLVGLVALVVKTIMDLVKGRAAGIETRQADMKTQRDTAWEERNNERHRANMATKMANCEARNARRLWDYAAQLRRLLIVSGTPSEAIPPEPHLEDCSLFAGDEDDDPRPPGARG